MDERFLKFSDRVEVACKLQGPKTDLFRNVSSKIYREVYGVESYAHDEQYKKMEEELTVLARAIQGLSEWSAKKVEIKIAMDVAKEFRSMCLGIDPTWPQDWKNSVYTHMGNVVCYAIRRRANLDNPPTPGLYLAA